MKRKIMTVALVGALLCGSMVSINAKQAEAASAKKTVTVTLDKKNPSKYVYVKTTVGEKQASKLAMEDWKKCQKKYGVAVKIQIVSMKGKPTEKTLDLFDTNSCMGKGCLLFNYPKGKFKRGVIFAAKNEEDIHAGPTYINMDLNEIKGVSKITYKITVTNPSGKKIFKSTTVKKGGHFM